MFYTTALSKLIDYTFPMFAYFIGEGGREINAETIATFCADIEKEWTALNFPFKPTIDEVVKYINLRTKTDEDRAFIVSDHDYANCELYIFLRYCILICSLDSYGRCRTIEGARHALARGTQALRTGVLISHIKRLRPCAEYMETFGGWEPFITWLTDNMLVGTSFTKHELPPDTERLDIGECWKKELKRAFEQE